VSMERSGGALYSLFHFAHAGEVFIEPAFVGPTYAFGKILGAGFYAVENADVLQAPTVVKQVVPGERCVHFYRDGVVPIDDIDPRIITSGVMRSELREREPHRARLFR
jgi:hypothetical protein